MKTADIKIGEDYSFIRYRSKYGDADPIRVTVLKTGVPKSSRTYGSWSPAHGDRRNNILVQRHDGHGTEVVRPIQIVRTWTEQEILNAQQAKQAEAARNAKQQLFLDRAMVARDVERALDNLGYEVKEWSGYPSLAREALKVAGFEIAGDMVLARFNAVRAVSQGEINTDVVGKVVR